MFKYCKTLNGLSPSQWGLCVLAWLYLTATQCVELMWFDSGELALAVHSGGMGHPPGQPLFTLLGRLISALPGSSLFWLNHLSVLSTIGSLVALWKIYEWSTGKVPSFWQNLCGISLLLVYPIWDQATRIEVYALANCCALWSGAGLCLLMRSGMSTINQTQNTDQWTRSSQKKGLLYSALFLGACGAVNPIFALIIGLASLWIFFSYTRFTPFEIAVSDLIRWGGWVIVGFSFPYLYWLWIHWGVHPNLSSVSEGVPFIWSNVETPAQFKNYFLGGDYQSNGQGNWSKIFKHSLVWCFWAGHHGFIIGCLIGWGLLYRIPPFFRAQSVLKITQSILLLSLLIGGCFSWSYTQYWPEVPDFTAYLLLPISLSCLGWMILFEDPQKGLQSNPNNLSFLKSSKVPHWCLWIIMSLCYHSFPSQMIKRTRNHHQLPLVLAHDYLKALPTQSILFVESDHWVFPLLYANQIQKVRPDVVVFNLGFMNSSWYWKWTFNTHPALHPIVLDKPNRLQRFVQKNTPRPIYLESLSSGRFFSQNNPPCPARWGLSLNCTHPLHFPPSSLLLQWALNRSHRDPITQNVMASLGWTLSLHAWMNQDADSALKLGYASLGLTKPLTRVQWWPAPPRLWTLASEFLIGSPIVLEALLDQLAQEPIDLKSKTP